jgi:hypothetical protein
MQKIRKHIFKTSGFIVLNIALLFLWAIPTHALDITLAWTSDPTVDGYKIYYEAGSSGPPYNGTGAAEGDSPIDVGWVDEFTLRALSDDEDYYFAITAYNQYGESGYSNEVTTARSVTTTSSVTAPAGGGGCFISALQ